MKERLALVGSKRDVLERPDVCYALENELSLLSVCVCLYVSCLCVLACVMFVGTCPCVHMSMEAEASTMLMSSSSSHHLSFWEKVSSLNLELTA